VGGGVCRGKVISDLHFKSYFRGEKAARSCFIIFGNCMRSFSNYSVTETKVLDVINFINERVVILEGSLQ
jgi:hypothetical protein